VAGGRQAPMLKYASMWYEHISANLGDNIQSLAAEQFLPRVDERFNRDALNRASGDSKYLMIMNGWFTTEPESWPPSESIVPVFIGFHISKQKPVQDRLLSEESIAYLKRHEPIGCRDRETERMLSARGVQAYYSKCLTLTFPERESPPENGKIFLVDVKLEKIPIPEELESRAVQVTHEFPWYHSHEVKASAARDLLDMYRREARLVITTRLHCAIPCAAMGIPVIFFGKKDEYRTALLRDPYIEINEMPGSLGRLALRNLRRLRRRFSGRRWLKGPAEALYRVGMRLLVNARVNWSPGPAPVSAEKEGLIARVKEAVRAKSEEMADADAFPCEGNEVAG